MSAACATCAFLPAAWSLSAVCGMLSAPPATSSSGGSLPSPSGSTAREEMVASRALKAACSLAWTPHPSLMAGSVDDLGRRVRADDGPGAAFSAFCLSVVAQERRQHRRECSSSQNACNARTTSRACNLTHLVVCELAGSALPGEGGELFPQHADAGFDDFAQGVPTPALLAAAGRRAWHRHAPSSPPRRAEQGAVPREVRRARHPGAPTCALRGAHERLLRLRLRLRLHAPAPAPAPPRGRPQPPPPAVAPRGRTAGAGEGGDRLRQVPGRPGPPVCACVRPSFTPRLSRRAVHIEFNRKSASPPCFRQRRPRCSTRAWDTGGPALHVGPMWPHVRRNRPPTNACTAVTSAPPPPPPLHAPLIWSTGVASGPRGVSRRQCRRPGAAAACACGDGPPGGAAGCPAAPPRQRQGGRQRCLQGQALRRRVPACQLASARTSGSERLTQAGPAEAARLYTEALAAAPGNATLRCNRSAARLALHQHAGALDDATRAVALAPDWPKAHFRCDS